MKKKIVLLSLVLFALCLLAGCGRKQETAPTQELKLYYNIDRLDYMHGGKEGPSARSKRKDGNYHVRMAVDGKQVDVMTADETLLNEIDIQDFMGLRFDENNLVTEVVTLDEFDTPLVARHGYAQQVNGDEFVFNTSAIYSGMAKTCKLSADTPVVSIGGGQAMAGFYGKIETDDELWVVTDEAWNITTVFKSAYEEPDDIYWNITRMYDSTAGVSTRQMSPLGYYAFDMAVNGEVVEIKVKDAEICRKMDARAAMCMMLDFDEDGYVTDVRSPGQVFCSWCNVTELTDDSVVATRLEPGDYYGSTYMGNFSQSCRVYDCSGNGAFKGEATTLRMGDKIHALLDSRGFIHTIFVVSRKYEGAKMAWNTNRMWDSKLAVSTRKAQNGWYEFTLAIDGKVGTYKTKNKDDAAYLDSFYCRGVVLSGNVIEKVISQTNVLGGSLYCSWANVTAIRNGQITAEKTESGTTVTYTGVLSTEHVAYNVSGNADVLGEKTTLQVGDCIHSFTDYRGEVAYSFVVSRPMDADVYWNVSRKYDTKTQQTTRTPAADGYYYIEMAVDGKLTTVKATREKATLIDSFATQCMALTFDKNGFVQKATSPKLAKKTSGGTLGSWVDVTSITSAAVKAVKKDSVTAVDYGATYTMPIDSGTKVYNVAGGFTDHCGEATKLQVGDRVHVLGGADGKAEIIYVVSRTLDADIYWSFSRKYDTETASTTRTPNASGYYEFDMCTGGKRVTVKTNRKATADFMDGCVAQCMALKVENGTVVYAVKADAVKAAKGGANVNASWAKVVAVNDDGSFRVDKEDGLKNFAVAAASDCKFINCTNVYAKNRGEYTKLQVGDTVHVLYNSDKQASYVFIVSSTSRVVDMTQTQYCAHADTSAVWQSWDGDVSKLQSGGCYRLTRDVTVTDKQGMTLNALSVSIDLNGHTIRSTTGRALLISGSCTVKICDHTGKGTIEAVGATDLGGGVLLVSNGVTNAYIFNVTLRQNPTEGTTYTTVLEGGTVQNAGALYMEGCTLENGHSTKGSNLFISAKGKAYLHGCTVTGGVSTAGNGAITVMGSDVANPAKVFLKNTAVTGNAAVSGYGVFLAKAAALAELSGKVVIGNNTKSDLYLSAPNLLTVTNLTAGSRIGVTVAGGSVLGKADKDYSAYFTGGTGTVIAYTDGSLEVKPTAHGTPDHCVCAGNDSACTHTAVTWTPWNGDADAVKAGGSFYLTNDVHITTDGGILLNNNNVNLCLNGFKITGTSRAFMVSGTSTLRITDCKSTGKLSTQGAISEGTGGGVIFVPSSKASLYTYGITMEQAPKADSTYVTTAEGGVIGCSGVLRMVKTTVRNGHGYLGGNINCYTDKGVALIDCTVENGTATQKSASSGGFGGNIRMGKGGTYLLQSTTVTGGEADRFADGVYAEAAVTVEITGNTVVKNNGTQNLFLDGNDILKIGAAGLGTSAELHVTLGSGKTSITAHTTYAAKFYADGVGKTVKISGGKLVITAQ